MSETPFSPMLVFQTALENHQKLIGIETFLKSKDGLI